MLLTKHKNKRADMGMGTLILFITFIVIAATAASVLLSDVSAVQSKAMNTQRETLKEIGTNMESVRVYAEDGTDNGGDNEVDYFYYTIKLAPGSEPVKYSDILLSFNLDDVSQDYDYSSTIDCGADPADASSNSSLSNQSGYYGVYYVLSSS
jgi:archaellin